MSKSIHINYIKNPLVRFGIICLFILVFNGCKDNTHHLDSQSVTYAKCWFLPKQLEKPLAITNVEGVMFDEQSMDTVFLKDHFFIEKIVDVVNSLDKDSNSTSYDFRVAILLKYNNGSEHILGLGENNGVFIDGQRLRDNDAIFELVDKYLYTKKQWRQMHLNALQNVCNQGYLSSEQFINDFDTLYQRYISKDLYSEYEVALVQLITEHCE